ncbi:MAG: ATP-dependent helicase [Anaerolineae bacterium]
MDVLEGLNQAQREAVVSIEGPVLVLAGPGSGKTRVLTHRVAYLVRTCGIAPHRIMAVTFTNKAAREMRDRLDRLLGERLQWLTLGTFHATCVRILRREAERLGLDKSFVIYDTDDQLRLVRQALKELNLDENMYQPPAVHGAISRAKNELIGPQDYRPATYWHEIAGRVYERYQALLRANNALDFDDILMFTTQLFARNKDVLEKYQNRYVHILVDEFQDTNLAQYELIKQISGRYRNIFVVGDEDQSIYSWRGADFRNVHRFRKDFPETKVILLERNYRSTQTILDVANAVISRNTSRTKKRLYTERGEGPLVTIYEAFDEQEEGIYVAQEIAKLVENGLCRFGDCAVMYRTNAQSRAIEDAFLQMGMPYKLVGATRFYQRREVKDILAYLRLIHNPYDLVSLTRIINLPPRGIGAKTISALESIAERLGVPLYTALQALRNEGEASLADSRGRKALLRFSDLLEEFISARDGRNALELLDLVLKKTEYEKYIRDGTEEGEERWENIVELRKVAAEYSPLPPELSLSTFLEEVSLASDVDNLDEKADVPTLLTLHAAKGLEFPMVFIVGMDEGIFPHSRSFGDEEAMEEERRLCYVGVTRAKDRLYLVHTFRRIFFGREEPSRPSRFLKDIPPHLVQRGGEEEQTPASRSGQPAAGPLFRTGDQVHHPKFGPGIIIESRLVGEEEEVKVAFQKAGIKNLMVSFAQLERIK